MRSYYWDLSGSMSMLHLYSHQTAIFQSCLPAKINIFDGFFTMDAMSIPFCLMNLTNGCTGNGLLLAMVSVTRSSMRLGFRHVQTKCFARGTMLLERDLLQSM